MSTSIEKVETGSSATTFTGDSSKSVNSSRLCSGAMVAGMLSVASIRRRSAAIGMGAGGAGATIGHVGFARSGATAPAAMSIERPTSDSSTAAMLWTAAAGCRRQSARQGWHRLRSGRRLATLSSSRCSLVGRPRSVGRARRRASPIRSAGTVCDRALVDRRVVAGYDGRGRPAILSASVDPCATVRSVAGWSTGGVTGGSTRSRVQRRGTPIGVIEVDDRN